MAIDSAEKRRSAYGTPWEGGGKYGVTPNGSPDSEWRQQVGHVYSGIATAAATQGGLLRIMCEGLFTGRGGTL